MNGKELILSQIRKKKLTLKQLCKIMHLKSEKEQAAFFNALKELEDEGKIFLDDGKYYQIVKEPVDIIQGIIHIEKSGYGRVFIENENEKYKYLIEEENLNGALDGDKVTIIASKKEGTAGYREAKVKNIVERKAGKAIFEFDGERLLPHNIHGNIRVVCEEETMKSLVAGHLVLVNLGTSPVAKIHEKLLFEGKIEEIVGHKDDPDVEVKAIGANHGFLTEFSPEALEELKHIKDHVTEEEMIGRKDLRDKIIFTIDGSHTKDIDDAISIEVNAKGNFVLGVHIADVGHYVKAGSALDEEARTRGTSAYLADSVIPMLPHQLSNGICSLNEGEDRLAKTVEMEIDDDGNIVSHKIYDSVIRSKKQMTYEEVNELITKCTVPEGYEPFEKDLLIMYLLSETLNKKRRERGNIEFTSCDISVIEDDEDTLFKLNEQDVAEKIIENFMILANETVTTHYATQNLPFVYRVHGDPNDDRLITSLRRLVSDGLCDTDVISLINKIKKHQLSSYDIDDFLRKYKGTEAEELISTAILRCMSKARYSEINEGHYGLALDYYTHFTSPIRRYPDLSVHRLIDSYKNIPSDLSKIERELPEICDHSSYMEREADTAERETLELKMAEYGEKHIGEEFRGQIVAFNPYGIDVKLDNNLKGIVINNDIKLSNAQDKYKLKLGQKVYAVIKDVSVPHRAIYFSLVGVENKKNKVLSLNNKD